MQYLFSNNALIFSRIISLGFDDGGISMISGQCKELYKLYYSDGVFKEIDIDPEIMKKVDEYFTDIESEAGSVSELLETMLADENNPEAFIIRKSVSDVIRHVETYLKMCPY